MSDWLKGLNPEQQEAALHNFGPMLILAGAGSGKTTVLVSRTGRLITEGIAKSEELCVLTFTNKAARELKERVAHKLGPMAKGIWAGTFHSFGLSLLKECSQYLDVPKNFGVIDTSDAKSIVKSLLKNRKFAEKEGFDIDRLLSILSKWRERGQTKADSDELYSICAEWILPAYQERKLDLGVVDFDDLLLLPIKLFGKYPEVLGKYQRRFSQIMVDEFQDTSKVQLGLVGSLSEVHKNISVVGDDDQSIYAWRGAEIDNILQFPHFYKECKVVRLVRNYRSTPEIVSLANNIIKQNTARHEKVLLPTQPSSGSKPELFYYCDDQRETEKVVEEVHSIFKKRGKLSDVAIIYRSNAQGATIESELRSQNLTYKISAGSSFFDQKEIKDVMAYLRCAFRPNEISQRRVLNYPARGVGRQSIERINASMKSDNIGFWQALTTMSANEEGGVRLFVTAVAELKEAVLNAPVSAGTAIQEKMREIGVRDDIFQSFKDPDKAEKRWRSIVILTNIVDRFVEKGGRTAKTIREFLEAMDLRDTDQDDDHKDAVNLMTLHSSKGLEFPVVILMGLEEDLIPHKTLGQDISEERRLFYVGVTRAKEHLIMTSCRSRNRMGKLRPVSPSRFILELDPELFIVHDGGRALGETERMDKLSDLFSKLSSQAEKTRLQ